MKTFPQGGGGGSSMAQTPSASVPAPVQAPPPLTDAQLFEAKLLADRHLKARHTGYDTSEFEPEKFSGLRAGFAILSAIFPFPESPFRHLFRFPDVPRLHESKVLDSPEINDSQCGKNAFTGMRMKSMKNVHGEYLKREFAFGPILTSIGCIALSHRCVQA